MDRKEKAQSDHSPSAQQPLRPVAVAGAKLDWPERLSVVALIMAAIVLLVYGGVLSALFLALAALMGWTRQHRLQAAQGKRSFSDLGRFITGAFMVVIAVALWPKQEAAAPAKEVASVAHIPEAKRGSKCADYGIVARTDFGVVADSETTFVSEPRTGASPVMMNVSGTRLPVPLEGDATVRETCRAGKWSQVRVLTSSQDHGPLEGWVPTSALRKVPTSASGRRIYQSADFEWPEGSLPHRSAAVKIMNNIMEQRSDCQALDHSSLVMNKVGRKSVFSIPCWKSDGEMLSFDFSPEDASNGRSFEDIKPIDKFAAIEVCKSAILASASHPSTVEFPALDYDFRDRGSGKTELLMSFKAKNGFGLQLEYDAQCDFTGKMLDDMRMSEADGA